MGRKQAPIHKMRIVIDTNIVFSAILNSNGIIGDLLFNSEDQFDFFSPEFIVSELAKYKSKLVLLSKLSPEKVDISIYQVLKKIELISPETIADSDWRQAYNLAANVDENDTPFLATALGIGAFIWTGDKAHNRSEKKRISKYFLNS